MSPEEMLLLQEQQTPEMSGDALFSEDQTQANEFNDVADSANMIGENNQDENFMDGKIQPIPYERLMMHIQQAIQEDPAIAEEVMQNIQQSGLSRQDIEEIAVLAAVSLANPDIYPSLIETIKSKFPETRESLTGDLAEDDDILTNWVIAAYVNEGGMI